MRAETGAPDGRRYALPMRNAAVADERLIALYLDMLAAERGAGTNTLAAYRRDLEDFSAYLTEAGRTVARRAPTICAPISASWRERGLRVATRGAPALGDAAALSVPLCRGPAQPTIRPPCSKVPSASAPCRRRSRSPRSIVCCASPATSIAAAPLPCALRAARLACLVETALRHRASGLRTRGVAGFGRAPRCARHRGARQRQQGAARAAQRAGQARHGRLPRAARANAEREDASRNGCSRRSAKAAI